VLKENEEKEKDKGTSSRKGGGSKRKKFGRGSVVIIHCVEIFSTHMAMLLFCQSLTSLSSYASRL